jgi:hypothetical protein
MRHIKLHFKGGKLLQTKELKHQPCIVVELIFVLILINWTVRQQLRKFDHFGYI